MHALSCRWGVAAVVLVAIAGCATAPQRSAAPLPADLRQLDRWQAHGRIAVSGPNGGGSGSFDWKQRNAQAQVEIRGPIGMGSVRLQVDGEAANPQLRLEAGEGKVLESQAAWDELEARLGASVPAGNLRFWMLGLAAPGEHRWQEPDTRGVTRLEQGGWLIDYQQYSAEPGLRVPSRMRAKNGAASVRIVVDRWLLGQ